MRPAANSSPLATNQESMSTSPSGTGPLRFPGFRDNFVDASDAGSLKRFVEMLGQAPAFMAVLRGSDHVLEFVNHAYFQLVGHRDIVGKSVYDAFPEIRNQGFMTLLDGVYESGIPYIGDETPIMLQRTPESPAELRYINFVYQPILDSAGDITGIFAHGVDVTDLVLGRQKSDELLVQNGRQARTYDAMLSSIQDFVYCFDPAGRFIFANNPLLELLGLSLDQIAGKTFHDLPYPASLAATLHENIARVVATGATVRDETPYTSPGGRSGHYEYIFSPIFGPDGKVEIVAGSTRSRTTSSWISKKTISSRSRHTS